jgi:hypothetical protein
MHFQHFQFFICNVNTFSSIFIFLLCIINWFVCCWI